MWSLTSGEAHGHYGNLVLPAEAGLRQKCGTGS